MSVELRIVRELPRKGYVKEASLIEVGGDYFVVSTAVAPITGLETLVFAADAAGNVSNWGEVIGGRGIDHLETIEALKAAI